MFRLLAHCYHKPNGFGWLYDHLPVRLDDLLPLSEGLRFGYD